MLTNSAEDTAGSVLQLLPVILQRLEATFAMQLLTAEDREAQSELQGLLCGCLQVITCPYPNPNPNPNLTLTLTLT